MIVLTTPVLMTDEDATRFLLFQKYYNVFKLLDENKTFDVKFGEVKLTFFNGKIQHIDKTETMYHIQL